MLYHTLYYGVISVYIYIKVIIYCRTSLLNSGIEHKICKGNRQMSLYKNIIK